MLSWVELEARFFLSITHTNAYVHTMMSTPVLAGNKSKRRTVLWIFFLDFPLILVSLGYFC